MKQTHTLTSDNSRRPFSILLIGCGGNGSALLFGLPYLHHALLVWGRSDGLQVVVMDQEIVSTTNCVRQPFGAADVGQNKARLLVSRVNLFHGLTWQSDERFFSGEHLPAGQDSLIQPDMVISCVDTHAARRGIHEVLTRTDGPYPYVRYWLDLGKRGGQRTVRARAAPQWEKQGKERQVAHGNGAVPLDHGCLPGGRRTA